MVNRLDSLIGSYPERRDLYIERSPIHFTDQLNCPMILFQGLEDKVVPPDQLQEETRKWCDEILAKSPSAIAFMKAGFNAESGMRGYSRTDRR